MKVLAFLFFSVLSTVVAHGTRAEADSAYMQRNYIRAVELYEQVVKTDSVDANTFYNQGNAYYRLKQYGKAVLAYQRALLRDPDFKDARLNLELAQQKLPNRFEPSEQNLLEMLTDRIANNTWLNTWGIVALVFFTLSLAVAGTYFLSSRKIVRQVAFFLCLFLLALTLICNIFGYATRKRAHCTRFVVLEDATLYSSPSPNSEKFCELHEGATVEVLESQGAWHYVVLPDDNEGWLMGTAGEIVK